MLVTWEPSSNVTVSIFLPVNTLSPIPVTTFPFIWAGITKLVTSTEPVLNCVITPFSSKINKSLCSEFCFSMSFSSNNAGFALSWFSISTWFLLEFSVFSSFDIKSLELSMLSSFDINSLELSIFSSSDINSLELSMLSSFDINSLELSVFSSFDINSLELSIFSSSDIKSFELSTFSSSDIKSFELSTFSVSSSDIMSMLAVG